MVAEHAPIALKAGIAKDIIDAVAAGRRPSAMSADEDIIYDFVTELHRNKGVADATFKRAEERFGKKGVVDITGIAGSYTFIAMQLNMARYLPPSDAGVCRVCRTETRSPFSEPAHTCR